MRKVIGLSVFMALFAQNALAQEADVDKRNMHIFCSSHLAMVSQTLDKEDDGRQALGYLSGLHKEEALKLGASQKHFADVSGYLRKVRNNSGKKWARLSERSKKVCLPGAEG